MFSSYRRLIVVVFGALGFHVGVRAVQLADLAVRLQFSAGELGLAASAAAATGVVTLVVGAALIDGIGRRPILLLGLIGTGAGLALTSTVSDYLQFLVLSVAYGLAVSFIDLAANTLGSDVERLSGVPGMTGFHAWFSLAAAGGAALSAVSLALGISFRPMLLGLGVVLVAVGGWTATRTLPPAMSLGSSRASKQRLPGAVYLAVAIVSLCFFGDGILETFLAVLVRVETDTVVWASGVTLALFHLASWGGRVLAQRLVLAWGDRVVVMAASGLAALAMGASLWGLPGWLAIVGFAVVGFALAPIVPVGMSLAGRYAPEGSAGRAIGLTNAVGYSAFIVGPGAAGVVADHTSLLVGLSIPVLTMVAVVGLAARLPLSEGESR